MSEDGQLKNWGFYINTTIDLHLHAPEIVEKINAFVQCLTDLFRNALATSQSAGEVSQDLDIEASSQFLVANVFGLLTMARATNDSKAIKAQVQVLKQLFN